MKLNIDKDWLTRKLAKADDAQAGAGGTSFDELKRNVERRIITPGALAAAQSELGRVVCFVRERQGLSRGELAQLSKLSHEEIEAIETQRDYAPSLRAVVYLADALDLSRDRLKELAGYVAKGTAPELRSLDQRFAANSKSIDGITDEQYEAVRALVEVLSDKK